ncbi:MAG: alkaline phosphatase family protein [Acidimicrobiales bacterium]|jgi:phospholipase C
MRIPAKGAVTLLAVGGLLTGLTASTSAAGVRSPVRAAADLSTAHYLKTATPIKHLVVIFDENVSFDHYFGTYPYAANPAGEPSFTAKRGTPTVNGLANAVTAGVPTGPLLTNNANESNPMRLDRSDPMTCDQDHSYSAEQSAADHGGEDLYAQNTGYNETLAQCLAGENYNGSPETVPAGASSNYAVMDYYDGNTVTALWNYAQHFAMSDNMFGTTYGPSTPGALNVTSAQTYGAICGPTSATINDASCGDPPGYDSTNVLDSTLTTSATGPTSVADQPAAGSGTAYGDADPYFDICSYAPTANGGDGRAPASTLEMGGNNIGEELTTSGITWGWFEGGFDDGYVPGHGTQPTTAQICSESHVNVGGNTVTDYIPHHEPFQYYASTANPMHLPPTSVSMVGKTDQANHQYDSADFWAAADAGNLPAVSYLKAPAYEDGHAGYSNPLDEQTWLVDTINHLESLRTWSSTAIVVTWDDSDGWYDHVLGPIVTGSETSLDTLTGAGSCGSSAIVPTSSTAASEEGRCGVGPRLPFLVISPFARANYVDNTLIDQSSVVSFIEYNWHLPALGNGAADTSAGSIQSMFDFRRPNSPLVLDGTTGEPAYGHHHH